MSNVGVYESDGNSSYNGLWLQVNKRLCNGLQFDGSYEWTKAIDDNSRNVEDFVLQNSYDVAGDRGRSDFDVRHHFVLSAVYDLLFKGNRFKEGRELSFISTLQTGNPLNFHLTNTSFTGMLCCGRTSCSLSLLASRPPPTEVQLRLPISRTHRC